MNAPITELCHNRGCSNHLMGGADYCMECLMALEEYLTLEQPAAELHTASPHQPGVKLDMGKSPVRKGLLEYFPRACLAVAEVSAFGASKYVWEGWREVPDAVNRYGDAEVRHICYAAIEGPKDRESKLLHAAHEAWNSLARLEKILEEAEIKENPSTP